MKLRWRDYTRFIIKYFKTQKLRVGMLAIAVTFGVGLQLLNPQITRYFIDQAEQGAAVEKLFYAALMFIAITFIQQLVLLVTTYLGANVAWKATNDIRIDLVEHCVNLDMDFHKSHQPAELLERVDGDVSKLYRLFSEIALSVINSLLLFVGIIVLLTLEDWRIGLGMSIFAVFSVYILGYIKSRTQKYWTKASEVNAEYYGFLGEQISSTEDIASSGARIYVMEKFYKMVRKKMPIVSKAGMTWASIWSATYVIFAVGNGIAIGISAFLWGKGLITIGTAYLIVNYVDQLRRPIDGIRMDLQELQVSGASIIRIKELFDIKPTINDGTKIFNQSKPVSIKMSKVNFAYEDGVNVLNNVSFELEAGRVLGVLGRTGSGKTTLARLLVRLYDTKSGNIMYNNDIIDSFELNSLRKNIAYVTQDVQIFSTSLRDNITLFDKEISDKEILSIIDELELTEWYDSQPNGLDTILHNGRNSLSAGQAQLLAFIRVFLKNPKVIILDEATSRIDPITEQLVEKALNRLMKNRTCIIVAHRLSTLDRADEILVLDKGRIVELGKRNNLLNDKNSKYYNLLQHGIEEVLV